MDEKNAVLGIDTKAFIESITTIKNYRLCWSAIICCMCYNPAKHLFMFMP